MTDFGLGWNQSTIIRLVEEYKKRPELWDKTHDMHRVQSAKYDAWLELTSMFECEITDLRRKMNSILASMRREKAKVRCGARSSWFLYDYLDFMPGTPPNNAASSVAKKHFQKKPSVEEEDEESEQSDNDGTQEEHLEDNLSDEEQTLVYIKQEPKGGFVQPITTFRPVRNTRAVSKPRLVRRPIRRKIVRETNTKTNTRLDSKILETLQFIRKSDFVKKKDECDSFGEYIADSLRKHDDRTQCMIKQAINNIMFEQEMKKFGSAPYQVLIAGVDENPLILDDNSK